MTNYERNNTNITLAKWTKLSDCYNKNYYNEWNYYYSLIITLTSSSQQFKSEANASNWKSNAEKQQNKGQETGQFKGNKAKQGK